jgi:hypothetical protein
MDKRNSQKLMWLCLAFVYFLSFGSIALRGHVAFQPLALGFVAIGFVVGFAVFAALAARLVSRRSQIR